MKRTVLTVLAIGVLLLIVTSPVVTIWLIKLQATRIVSDSLQGLTTSSLATMNVSEGFIQTALAVNGGSEASQRDTLARLAESTRMVDSQYEAHRKTLLNAEEHAKFDVLLARRDDYRRTRAQVVELVREGKRSEAEALFIDDFAVKYHAYSEALGDVVELNVMEARAAGQSIMHLCNILLGVQVVLLAFFFIYGFFVPFTAILERLTRKPVVVRP